MTLAEVYITRTSTFLPNDPVSNDEIEDYLGIINEQASKSKRIVLRSNKIQTRYYAIKKDGTPTHTNAEMVSLAIRNMLSEDELKEIDLLSCGTSSPDQLMPSHGVMVHGYLPETTSIEVTSPAGVCCSGMHAFKYAYMAIRLGQSKKAVTSGSERLSKVLRADQFEAEVKKLGELEQNPYLAFEKDFLRWMLSDGASAFLLENKPNPNGISLKVDWIEAFSFANEAEACMYMGAEKLEDGSLKSYKDYSPQEVMDLSILSIKQDVKLLGENIVRLGFKKLKQAIDKYSISVDEINWFLPHMSSHFFEDKIYDELKNNDMEIPKDKWFTNLASQGNVGSASIYMMVDLLFKSGKLKSGDKVLLAVPESSRFSYVFSLLTVC